MYVLSLTKLLKTKVVHKNERQCCSMSEGFKHKIIFCDLSDKGTFMQKI